MLLFPLTILKCLKVEAELECDPIALRLLFHQAVAEVNRGYISTKDRYHRFRSTDN
jgi:hypothetical protein